MFMSFNRTMIDCCLTPSKQYFMTKQVNKEIFTYALCHLFKSQLKCVIHGNYSPHFMEQNLIKVRLLNKRRCHLPCDKCVQRILITNNVIYSK